MNICSLVNKRRLGLVDHARALQIYCEKSGNAGKVAHSFLDLLRLKNNDIMIVWDNSIRTILLALTYRLFYSGRILYYYHEPGGIGQKLMKNDPFLYAILATCAENLNKRISHKILVPKLKDLPEGNFIAPLLFHEQKIEQNDKRDILTVGLLGTPRPNRFIRLLQQLTAACLDVEIEFFPSDKWGTDLHSKQKFLSACDAVWNVYAVSYNQSGVTGDCIMSGKPVFHSKYEPYASLLSQLKISLEIEVGTSYEALERQFNKHIETIKNQKLDLIALKHAASKFGGNVCFEDHWLKIFEQVMNEK